VRGSGGGLNVALLGNNYDDLFSAAKTLSAAIEERLPELTRPRIAFDPTQPQLSVEIDRRRAADLGVDLPALAATLRAMIDGDELVDLNIDDEAVPILLESASGEINDPTDLVNLYVGTRHGGLVPLSSVATLREEGVATELNRHAQRRSIEISIERADAYALQAAVDDLRELAGEVLPNDIALTFLGEAATLEETSRDVALTYILAIVVIFLVLAAQFEGFTSALVVTCIVPFGVAAAIFALLLTGTSLNIYSQIGLVLLIGLMAKNSVLVVEFAEQLRDRGLGQWRRCRSASCNRLGRFRRPRSVCLVYPLPHAIVVPACWPFLEAASRCDKSPVRGTRACAPADKLIKILFDSGARLPLRALQPGIPRFR
jgi:multidrug efflux pump subunit AcrB